MTFFDKFDLNENDILRVAKDTKFVDRYAMELRNEDKSKILRYFFNKLILIDFNETSESLFYDVLQLSGMKKGTMKFLLFGRDVDKTKLRNLQIFNNLEDLRLINEDLFDEVIKECRLSLQGRSAISLKKLIDSYEEIVEFTTPTEIFRMLNEDYAVGEEEENLPLFYIPRTVFTKLLKTDIIFTEEEDLFIINFKDDSKQVKDLLKKKEISVVEIEDMQKTLNKIKIIATSEDCSLAQFEEIHRSNEDRPLHYLKIVNEESFLLVMSTNNTFRSRNDKLKKFLIEEENILAYFDNPINVICAQPGMGKSTLFTFLKKNCDSSLWTWKIDLKTHNEDLKMKHSTEEMLCRFVQKIQNEDLFLKNIEELFLKKKKVVIFLDGLDEVQSECVDVVLKITKELALMGFRVWLSSRQNFQSKIEEYLNIFVLEIAEFEREQQINYVRRRLKNTYEDKEIEEIVRKVLGNLEEMNVGQVSGVPLQLHVITECFLSDKHNFQIVQDDFFVLTKLYRIFFEGRYKYAVDKLEGKNVHLNVSDLDDYLEKYEIPALQCLFDDAIFEELDLDLRRTRRFFEDIVKDGDRLGTIVRLNRKKAVFLHSSFAEYFACSFLRNNFKKAKILKKVLFTERYRNLLLMLNLMLAEDSSSHLAVLGRNSSRIIEDNGLDNGGRNLLHMAACIATRHPDLRFSCGNVIEDDFQGEKKDCQEIVKKLLKLNPFQEDKIFNWTPLEYALASKSLYVVEEILKNHEKPENLKRTIEKFCNVPFIVYHSLKFGYTNLLSVLSVRETFSVNSSKSNLLSTNLLKTFFRNLCRNHIENLDDKFKGYEDIIFRRLEDQLLYYEIPALWLLLGDDLLRQLNLDLRRTKIFLKKINNEGDILDIMEMKNEEIKFKHEIFREYFASVFLCNNFDKVRILRKQLFSKKYQNFLLMFNMMLAEEKPLPLAVIFKNLEEIEHFIDDSIVYDSGGRNLLHLASYNGTRFPNFDRKQFGGETIEEETEKNKKIVELLIDRFDPFENDKLFEWNCLEYALANENLFLVEEILKKNSKFDEDIAKTIEQFYSDASIAYYSCYFSFINLLNLVLKKDCNLINLRNVSGETLLHVAVKRRNRAMLNLVLEKNIDTSLTNLRGETALHYATSEEDLGIVCRLIEKMSNLNIYNLRGESVLHYAATRTNTDIVYMLLRKNIDLDWKNEEGETVLHYAAKNRSLEIMELLLKEAVDVEVKNKFGKTALDVADEAKNYSVKNLVLERIHKIQKG